MSIKELFDRDGVVIIRDSIQPEVAASWRMTYEAFHDPERTPEHNPVAVNERNLEPLLSVISTHPAIVVAVAEAFGVNGVALYNRRFVVKDKHARGAVFLHHDTPYHQGFPTKLSAFVALSPVSPENGGMKFWAGTHRYGYLGDAGELRREALAPDAPWECPTLKPGDFVLMHSACWHESLAHVSGCDRIMADIIYQPSNDPTGIELVRGDWETDLLVPKEWRDNLFVRSRVSRIKDLQAQVDAIVGGDNG